jgi:hypothetical protein
VGLIAKRQVPKPVNRIVVASAVTRCSNSDSLYAGVPRDPRIIPSCTADGQQNAHHEDERDANGSQIEL